MKILDELFKYENNVQIFGLTDELNIFYVLNKFNSDQKNIIVLTSSLYQANLYFEKFYNYTNDIALYPMDDFITSIALAVSPELNIKRLETIERINNHEHLIVVTNLMGYLHYLSDKSSVSTMNILIKKGLNINRDEIIKKLDSFGYNHDTIVTTTGDYAVRGFIVDVFLIDQEHPIRIEFFGDEIESIRFFDESTQLSIDKIDNITCLPFKEITTLNHSSLYDYLDKPDVFYIDEHQINLENQKIQNEINEYKNSCNENDTLKQYMYQLNEITPEFIIYLNKFDTKSHKSIEYQSSNIDNFNSNFDLLKNFVNKKVKNNKHIVFCLSRIKEIDNITELFPNLKLIKQLDDVIKYDISVFNYKINAGFEINNIIFISEFDIEKNSSVKELKYKNTLKIGKKIKDYNELIPGDYVVHYMHGIGKYGGITSLTKNGIVKDYLLINYLDNDKIYVPVEKINTIFKYASQDEKHPKLNKLSSLSWSKTKADIRKKIHDISNQLIKLYAARKNIRGPIFMDDSLDELFANGFNYVLTEDQKKSISDIYKDLSSPIPMDRLLCGDVGFGKTEVAFRAMFKTITNGFQVAYLCPTTILSNQQYESAKDRFKDFPVNIALINRFTKRKEVLRIINALREGNIDIIFGTHRLLSKDIIFKNLGLLVVDEEQRFGVTHKEKIKELKANVNVLTLSATPIPRTLKMSLTGLRDLSIIDTAPVNRYPVQTYVLAENDLIIKDAIEKELARHGQIFILYNRVESILSKVNQISILVPNARICYAHGQMSKTELENVMNQFIDYQFDILICTTIIETGIDIANANTLIVIDADTFGLSQLYQLRGRVGRSNRIAYAYLMYNKNKMLNDIAIKRLQAIKEFTELGSGYRIAMRDLSLRGAGDLLGSDQAGFVSDIGMDLYMKLIDDEVRRMNGETVIDEEESNNSLIDVETHISDNYVSDEKLKIEIHQKINEIDSYDKLIDIKSEIEDRFGKINENIEIYMYEEWLEKIAQQLKIKEIKQTLNYVEILLPKEVTEKIKFDKIFMEAYEICSKFKFKNYNSVIIINLPLLNLNKHFVYYLVALLNLVLEEYTKNK